ncbi:Protein mono-ADP-ribosyltransferase parp14 [Bulinus truncatus]|nr:Protein mono-ADP-ribosyltransferase parp14 [Bulinus truncatus]
MPSSIEWKYKKGDTWHKFEALLNSEIEREFQNKALTHQLKDSKDHKYVIDFLKMKKICQDGKSQNKALEIGRFSTKGEPFPECWDPMSENENLNIVEVKSGTSEYKKVEQHFKSRGANFAIKKIQRIQNKSLYDQYCVKKKELELHNPKGHQNEQFLFHGTSATPIQQINANGFNRSYCGVNGTVYGKGVYFAVNSSYSVGFANQDAQGNRYMYRARVLTGEFIATNAETKYLPNKPGSTRHMILVVTLKEEYMPYFMTPKYIQSI